MILKNRHRLRKCYQKKLTHLLKECNRNIEKDDIWKGRFYIVQKDCRWYQFEDNSGGYLFAHLRCYDHKTGYYHDYILDYAPWYTTIYWSLYMDIMNNFIVDQVRVWREIPRPSIDSESYIKKDKITNHKSIDNWYIKYEEWENWRTKN